MTGKTASLDVARARRRELADFLRTRRARLQPADVRLPARGRRRTPGLRREEVAQLAGMSTSWYTWLEQARTVRLSPDALNDLARALRLSPEERCYLYSLALGDRLALEPPQVEAIAVRHHRLLSSLDPKPAVLLDLRGDVIAQNRGSDALWPALGQEAEREPNALRFIFTDAEFRNELVDWKTYAEAVAAYARLRYKLLAGDARAEHIVASLKRLSPEFASFWRKHDLRRAPGRSFAVRGARTGPLSFDLFLMDLAELPGTALALCVPRDEESEVRLDRLVNATVT